MKVRLKTGQVEFVVIEESPSYYILEDHFSSCKGKFMGAKANYEPVQKWDDVTQYCGITLVDSTRDEYAICYANDLVESPFKKDVYKVTRNDKTGVIKVERKRA